MDIALHRFDPIGALFVRLTSRWWPKAWKDFTQTRSTKDPSLNVIGRLGGLWELAAKAGCGILSSRPSSRRCLI